METAIERYTRVLDYFKKELKTNPRRSINDCCRELHCNIPGFESWLRRQHVNIRELRRDAGLDFGVLRGNASGFITLNVPKMEVEDELQGVSLVFPNGTQVSIRRCGSKALLSFIRNYGSLDGKEVASCSL